MHKVFAGSGIPGPRRRHWGTFSPLVLGLSGLLAITLTPEHQDVFWGAILLLAAAAFCIGSDKEEQPFGPVAVAVLSWAVAAIVACSDTAPLLPVLVAAAIASCWAIRARHRKVVKTIRGRTAQGAEYAAEQGKRRAIQLLAAASHDLRQPVQALLAQVDFIGRSSHDSDISDISISPRQFKEIQTSVNTLAEMLNDLLDVNRVNLGIYEATLQPVNIRLLLQEVEQVFAINARTKGLRLLIECPEDVWIKSDLKLLRRIVFNLVVNAIRYTDTGGIRISCLVVDGRAMFQTEDTGRGMNVEGFSGKGAFGPRPSTSHHGLGLGLGIVNTMALQLGHTLRVVSELGEGTQIEVDLGECVAAASVAGQEGNVAPLVAADILIAIVEDDAAVREALANSLTNCGYRTVSADSGENLQTELHRIDATPALVIADLNLRINETGLDVIHALRKIYPESRIPAILLTGDVAAELQGDASLADLRVLYKPVRPSDLRKLVNELVFTSA